MSRGRALRRFFGILASSLFLALFSTGITTAGQCAYVIKPAGRLVCPRGTRHVEVISESQKAFELYCIDDSGGGSIPADVPLGLALFGLLFTGALVTTTTFGVVLWVRARRRSATSGHG